MLEGLEQSDVNLLRDRLADKINDLGIAVAERKGQEVDYECGKLAGLVEALMMISKAQRGEL